MSRLAVNLWNDFNMIGYDEGWIKSNTELPDNIVLHLFAILLYFLHKLFGSALCDRSKVLNKVSSRHTYTIILNN